MQGVTPSADGVAIAYETRGAGFPALVFVHGWSCSRRYWDLQIPVFAQSALVVAIDLAGHGESTSNRENWSVARFGNDVTAVVDALELQDVILIGHSMGVDVILEAARELEGRVRGLVWVDEYNTLSAFMTQQNIQQRLDPFRARFVDSTHAFVRGMFGPTSDPVLVDRICRNMSSAPERIAVPSLEATWDHGPRVPGLLAELGLPVVTINAASPPTDAGSMRRNGVEVLLVSNTGHFPMLERPQEFNLCLSQAIQLIGADRA
jgi:pimeloyl-ACP methyl ester carboxylesterase